ncbi:MAG: redoxin domain-containing protein [Candidatus Limnocylindrales bacterium]
MSSRVAVVTGLFAGILTAGLLLVGLVAFAPQISDTLGIGGPVVIGSTPGPTRAPTGSPAPTAPGTTAAASASPGDSAEPSDVVETELPSASAVGTPVPSRRSPVPGAFHVGEPAPKLVLPLLGGGTIDLASLKGQPVWVNFMATYCPPCRDEFPVMSNFQSRYADTGLVVLAVDVREDVSLVQTFVGETGATFPVALDADGVAQKAWGAVALPVHFWIDAEGIVRDGALGGIGPDIMVQSLALILPGVTVTP